MKRTLIAAALALPFVAQAAPVASFNDNAPIAGTSEVANTVVLAKADFHYPAF